MKRGIVFNSEIVSVMAHMGHGDGLCIADAGLPIPEGRTRVDISLRAGVPSFIETVQTILEELCVERIMLADEIKTKNPTQLKSLEQLFELYEKKFGRKIVVEFVPHSDFKKNTASSVAVVRTGECTPYSNIILYSGVVF